jgi:hypothetical protein
MSIVIAAIVLVGTLCVLNLLLTFGVMRRLREHSAALSATSDDTTSEASETLKLRKFVGKPLPEVVQYRPRLLGLFHGGCSTCVVEAAHFARTSAGEGTNALAAIIGKAADSEALLDLLRDVPKITGPEAAQLMKQLELYIWPSFLRMDADGVVLSAGVTVEAVLEPSQV